MIVGIQGKIEHKELTNLHVNVNGIIYQVWVSLNCSSAITKEDVKLFTTYIVKEDSQSLYGFVDINELESYVYDKVIELTNSKQHPTSKRYSAESYMFYQLQ